VEWREVGFRGLGWRGLGWSTVKKMVGVQKKINKSCRSDSFLSKKVIEKLKMTI